MNDHIAGFDGAFDYDTVSGLIAHLRKHAESNFGSGAGDSDYDPETLNLELNAADALELLKASRNFEKAACLEAFSVISKLSYESLDLKTEVKLILEYVVELEAELKRLRELGAKFRDERDQMITRARDMLFWVPKKDVNRVFFEALNGEVES